MAARVRRAELADYPAIMEIDPDIFDGMDYLPTNYTTMMRDPRVWGYVAEVKGEVIAFVAKIVVEDDGYQMDVSARIKPEYRGRGMFTELDEAASQDVLHHHGPLTNVWVASDKPAVFTERFWRRPSVTLIRRMAHLCYQVPHGMVVKLLEDLDPSVLEVGVEGLDTDRARFLLCDPQTRSTILPDPYIIALDNFLPLKNCEKNLKLIATRSKVLASFKENSSTDVRAVSFSTLNLVPMGTAQSIFLHMYEHVDVLLAHLVKHLEHASRVVSPESLLCFRIDFPASIDKERVKAFLKPFFGSTFITKAHPDEFAIIASSDRPENISKL